MNDYTGQFLHDAHYRDLLSEARSGSHLQAAQRSGEPRPFRSPKRRLGMKLAWALMAALLASLAVTASIEPPNRPSMVDASAHMIFQRHTIGQ